MNQNTALSIDAPWRPRLHPSLRMEVIEGEAIVLDRDQNRVHHLNEVATFILGICTGERTGAEIVAGVVERFDVDQAVAGADVRDLLTRMRDLDIVV